jgi:hypothetical protein
MAEALARVGAAIDKWGAEQRLREWARDLNPPDHGSRDHSKEKC